MGVRGDIGPTPTRPDQSHRSLTTSLRLRDCRLEEKALGRDYTMGVINETYDFWKKLTASGAKTV